MFLFVATTACRGPVYSTYVRRSGRCVGGMGLCAPVCSVQHATSPTRFWEFMLKKWLGFSTNHDKAMYFTLEDVSPSRVLPGSGTAVRSTRYSSCCVNVRVLFCRRGSLPLQSSRSLSCDHGFNFGDELR